MTIRKTTKKKTNTKKGKKRESRTCQKNAVIEDGIPHISGGVATKKEAGRGKDWKSGEWSRRKRCRPIKENQFDGGLSWRGNRAIAPRDKTINR